MAAILRAINRRRPKPLPAVFCASTTLAGALAGLENTCRPDTRTVIPLLARHHRRPLPATSGQRIGQPFHGSRLACDRNFQPSPCLGPGKQRTGPARNPRLATEATDLALAMRRALAPGLRQVHQGRRTPESGQDALPREKQLPAPRHGASPKPMPAEPPARQRKETRWCRPPSCPPGRPSTRDIGNGSRQFQGTGFPSVETADEGGLRSPQACSPGRQATCACRIAAGHKAVQGTPPQRRQWPSPHRSLR